jgi:hypothetical protein
MTKIKDGKSLIGKALTLASLTLIALSLSTVKVSAIGSVPAGSRSALDPISTSDDGTMTRAKFNSRNGSNLPSWYGSDAIFLQLYKGITFYSPVPAPEDVEYSSKRSFAQSYENSNIDPGSVPNSWTLYTTSYKNYKIYSAPLNDTSLDNLTGGGTYNAVAPFAGSWGEYRYLGYTNFGSSINNPYFPSDYNSHYTAGNYGYDDEPWWMSMACPGNASVWDDTSSEWYGDKINAISLLLSQNPDMGYYGGWDPYGWANKLSLRTDPTKTSPIFVGTRGGHSFYRTLTVADNNGQNLRIVSTTVRDKQTGDLMGYYTMNPNDPNNYGIGKEAIKPLIPGDKYTVEVQIKNMSTIPTKSDPSLVDVGFGYGSVATSSVAGFTDNQFKDVLESDGTYGGLETKTFNWDLAFDENVGKALRVTAMIDQVHNDNAENLDRNDDTSNILFKVAVPPGNIGTTAIKLVGTDGREYTQAKPGADYKIRYYVGYSGADIKKAIYRTYSHGDHSHTVFDHWEFPKKSIPLNIEIDRNIPPVHGFADVYKETIPKTSEIHAGDTYVYTTKAFRTYEVPIIKTLAQASSVLSSIVQDDNSKQYGSHALYAEWHEAYDFSVSSVTVKPVSETPYQAGNQTYAVQYTITNKTPSWIPPYEKDVHTVIKLGSQTMYFTDHVAQGDNKNITHEIKVNVNPATDRTLTGTVSINYDKMVWEEDVLRQKNNQASATTSVDSPYNPWNGPPVQHTSNSWTQNYNIHSWTGYHKTYVDRSSQSFNIFTPGSSSNQSLSQNESYSITSIKFKSKLTTDTNQGANGWVELSTGTAGMIKAGYGYELQITVNYKTNAFTQPQPIVTGSYQENGTWVRPFNVTPNLPNELFVKTPDGKIISVDGYAGTNAGLDYTLTGDRTNSTWVYTVKSKDTLGVKSAPKLYIDPNTTDGTYNLQVFTPSINGVPTKTAGSKLCDSKTVKIKVQGSSTDDLKSHITQ